MVVCFIGHRTVSNEEQLRTKLTEVISQLIAKGADTFLFGSKSKFDAICWQITTELKKQYPFIKRIYVRAAFPDIQEFYANYLLESYEETYFPEEIRNAGRYSYVERNQDMIDSSDVCIFYYNPNYKLPLIKKQSNLPLPAKERKSGTAIAFTYAQQKKKHIINLYKD